MGNLSSTPEQEHYTHSCKANNYEAAVQALQHNRKLVDKRICHETGDKALHLMAREPMWGHHMRDAVNAISCAALHEGMSRDEAERLVVKVANQHNYRGQTPLMLACEHGNLEAITVLLEVGVDPWLGDTVVHRTCMHYAAGTGQVAAIELLISYTKRHPELRARGARPRWELYDVPSATGMTPIHYAAWRRQIAAVNVLAKANASLYAQSGFGPDPECPLCAEGSTPLHLAALKGSQGTVKALLKAYVRLLEAHQQQRHQLPNAVPPADLRTLQDMNGSTPFAVARANNQFHVLADLNPLTPLARVLAQDSPQDRAIGVPRLQELAAKVAHGILAAQVSMLHHLLASAEQQQQPSPANILTSKDTAKVNTSPLRSQSPVPMGSPQCTPPMARSSHLGVPSRSPPNGLQDSPVPGELRAGSQHGSTLAESALLLASMPSRVRASLAGNEVGLLPKSPSTLGGLAGQVQCGSCAGGVEAGLQGNTQLPARPSLNGTFSLRSSSMFTAQVEQEVLRRKSTNEALGVAETDSGQRLQHLQQMQQWRSQDLEDTLSMARTHRLTRGVEVGDEERQELAMLAVVSYAGEGPSSAVMMDARGRPDNPAVTALTAATANMVGTPAPRTPVLQRQRSLCQESAEARGDRPGPSLEWEVSALEIVAEGEDEAGTSAPQAAVSACGVPVTPFGRGTADCWAWAPAGQKSQAAAPPSPLVSLVSISRQSSQVVGRVAMPAAEVHTPAGDTALARLASLTRQPSQGPVTRSNTSVQACCDRDISGLVRHVSASRQASLISACSAHSNSLSQLDHMCEEAARANGDMAVDGQQKAAAFLDGPDDDDDVCGVCLDSGSGKFVQIHKCQHDICVNCAAELVRLHEYKPALCPLCRGVILGFGLPIALR